LSNQIARLIEVPGIGNHVLTRLKKAWLQQKAIKEVMIFLQGHGVSPTYAVKIYKVYADQAIRVVSENPYQLPLISNGIGYHG